MAAPVVKLDAVELTEQERRVAIETGRKLASHLNDHELRLQVLPETGSEQMAEELLLPGSAVRLLATVLGEMARGNTVAVIPVHAELTTQKAADLLNVSRPYLISLLESGAIPFHVVGAHRRIRCDEVLQYKRRIDEERRKTLELLTAEAQELNLGY